MDSQDCKRNELLGAINKKLDSGELTFDTICQQLKDAVDAEVKKPRDEVDYEYLTCCQNILDRLIRVVPDESKQPYYEQELMKQIKKTERSRTRRKRAIALAFATAAVLILFVVGDRLFHRKWLEGDSTDDMQQYEIAGQVVDPGLVEKGNASHTSEVREVTTQSIDEVIEVLGASPLLPSWYPEGWKHRTFYVAQTADLSWFYEDLESNNVKGFAKYEIKRFYDVQDAAESFEQNEAGRMVHCNGWDVYLTVNVDKPTAVWLDGNLCYTISGPIREDELLEMIKSIDRGDKPK